MRKALLYGNCQMLTLHGLLRETLAAEGIDAIHVQEVHLLSSADQTELRRHAENLDILIAQPVTASPARPGSDELAALARLNIIAPNAYFSGYHQPLGIMNAPHGRDTGCLATWSLIRAGMTPAQVAETLLRDDAFDANEVLAFAETSLAELQRRETEQSISVPVATFIRERWQSELLFHTTNHPTRPLLLHMANGILDALQASGAISNNVLHLSNEPHHARVFASIDFIDHLVLPGIARAIGVDTGIANTTARMSYRPRFELPGQSDVKHITALTLAKEQLRWCGLPGWQAGIVANDVEAARLPKVRM